MNRFNLIKSLLVLLTSFWMQGLLGAGDDVLHGNELVIFKAVEAHFVANKSDYHTRQQQEKLAQTALENLSKEDQNRAKLAIKIIEKRSHNIMPKQAYFQNILTHIEQVETNILKRQGVSSDNPANLTDDEIATLNDLLEIHSKSQRLAWKEQELVEITEVEARKRAIEEKEKLQGEIAALNAGITSRHSAERAQQLKKIVDEKRYYFSGLHNPLEWRSLPSFEDRNENSITDLDYRNPDDLISDPNSKEAYEIFSKEPLFIPRPKDLFSYDYEQSENARRAFDELFETCSDRVQHVFRELRETYIAPYQDSQDPRPDFSAPTFAEYTQKIQPILTKIEEAHEKLKALEEKVNRCTEDPPAELSGDELQWWKEHKYLTLEIERRRYNSDDDDSKSSYYDALFKGSEKYRTLLGEYNVWNNLAWDASKIVEAGSKAPTFDEYKQKKQAEKHSKIKEEQDRKENEKKKQAKEKLEAELQKKLLDVQNAVRSLLPKDPQILKSLPQKKREQLENEAEYLASIFFRKSLQSLDQQDPEVKKVNKELEQEGKTAKKKIPEDRRIVLDTLAAQYDPNNPTQPFPSSALFSMQDLAPAPSAPGFGAGTKKSPAAEASGKGASPSQAPSGKGTSPIKTGKAPSVQSQEDAKKEGDTLGTPLSTVSPTKQIRSSPVKNRVDPSSQQPQKSKISTWIWGSSVAAVALIVAAIVLKKVRSKPAADKPREESEPPMVPAAA